MATSIHAYNLLAVSAASANAKVQHKLQQKDSKCLLNYKGSIYQNHHIGFIPRDL